MIVQNISVHETCYDILNVKEDATHDEIRSTYRSLLLISHPDKLPTSSHPHNPNAEDQFLKIQKAWETLCDPKSRSLYDRRLRAERYAATVVADDISLCDMTLEEDDDGEKVVLELYYQCRCGDYFSVNSSELREVGYELSNDDGQVKVVSICTDDGFPGTLVLSCGSCSLKIRLLLDSNTEGSV